MKRRNFIASAATLAGLPRIAIGQSANKTLIFVPQANLTSLDPIWTTATVTRNYAYLVFDTLYGTDANLEPKPQMAEGHTVDQDGKRWTIKLRDGLLFHDGEPVRASDCVVSLQRWMKRDSFGQTLAQFTDALEASDDRTLVFRLKRPFPPLLRALAKTQPSPAMIMPARIAATDPSKQITDIVGSGPFRFLPDQYIPGSRAVFAKFDRYGWPDDPKIETLHTMFIEAPDEATRKNACEEIQKEALTEGMYLPLGQYFQSAAWRTNLTGHVKAQPPLFWNVKKT